MKETVKAGIGGYAFTLDKDAYETLESYLNNLRIHFENKNDGAEVITDIESRMSELLQMKLTSPNSIITLPDALQIIEIMGNPADFEDDASVDISNDTQQTNRKKESWQIDKKLYRDMDNSVMGGVCSGLGQYFRVDPVIIRIAYVLGVLLTHQFSNRLSSLIFISYFILWAVMPKAKTIVQKLAMSGQDPTIIDIEKGNVKTKEMRGSGLGKALKKTFKVLCGIILYLTGISVLLAVFFALFFPSVLNLPTIKEFLEIMGLYSTNLALSISLAWIIPAFMIIYFAIRLMIKFRSKDFAILGIAFIIWIGACSYTAAKCVKYAKDYQNEVTVSDKFIPGIKSDTLFLQLDSYYKYAESLNSDVDLHLLDGTMKSWFFSPYVEIRKSDEYKNFEIEIKKTAFEKNLQRANDKAKNAEIGIVEKEKAVLISPHIYNKNQKWDREVFKIIVYCPTDKTVVTDNLLRSRTIYNNNKQKDNNSEDVIPGNKNDSIPSTNVKII